MGNSKWLILPEALSYSYVYFTSRLDSLSYISCLSSCRVAGSKVRKAYRSPSLICFSPFAPCWKIPVKETLMGKPFASCYLFSIIYVHRRFTTVTDLVSLVSGFGKMYPGMPVGYIFRRRVGYADKFSVFIIEVSRLPVRILDPGKLVAGVGEWGGNLPVWKKAARLCLSAWCRHYHCRKIDTIRPSTR